jgi:hypothetical protein
MHRFKAFPRPASFSPPCAAVALVFIAGALLALTGFASAADTGNLGMAFRPKEAPPPPPSPTAASSPSRAREGGLPGDGGLRVVVVGGARSLASIDGKIVRVGDMVNGMRVADISAQGVLLVGEGGARERLGLSPSAVKRNPAAATQVSKESRP